MIAATFIATAATVFVISAMLVYRQGAQQHNDTRLQLETLLTNLADAERGQRGYLLTGDSAYLEPYNAAIIDLKSRFKDIDERMATDDPSRAEVAKLGPLVDQKLEEMARTITLRQTGDAAGALEVVNGDQGRQLTNQIVDVTGRIQKAENDQLGRDRNSVSMLANLARDIAVISLVATLALAILVYWLYLKAIQSERQLDRAKDEFVSLASHQLRTPATGIKSILSTLIDGDFGPLNDRQKYFMRRALESNQRELHIIEELLNVAKADAGRLILHESKFDLTKLVRSISQEQAPAIAAKKLQLKVKEPSHDLTIVADEEKLYMAIGNLLDNARKYTPEGGSVHLSLCRRHHDIEVEVADTGVGIGPEEVKHIFDRFQRAREAIKGNVEGAGLGLYLALRIAELHGGTIEVSSKVGKGTKFVMILPQGDVRAAQDSTG